MTDEQALSVDLNTDDSWTVTAQDVNGNPVAFQSNDGLEAIVWQGADSAAYFSPTVAWLSAAAGTITLSVASGQTASLTPGVYPLEVTVIPNGTTTRLRVLDTWMELRSSPGSSSMPPVYCSYQDLVDAGGGKWLETLRQAEGLANFTRERARARYWLDTIIAKAFRPWASARGVSDWYAVTGPPDARNVTMVGYLADGFLLVNDDIIEIVALKTLGARLPRPASRSGRTTRWPSAPITSAGSRMRDFRPPRARLTSTATACPITHSIMGCST